MDAQTDAILAEAREWLRTRTGTMESESLIAGLIAEVVRLANANDKQSLTPDERKAIEYLMMGGTEGPGNVERAMLDIARKLLERTS